MSNSHPVPEAVATAISAGENAVKAMREFVGYTVEERGRVRAGRRRDRAHRIR
ncbi:hypothetical protein [Ollibium composti]|uniref:hypothetical protein n=1 Tax=Ollibium composti TaxID=2675109 RepID=UPI001E3B8C65|nr:hypothetical protein [Mesorhizobium composti]